MTVPSYTEEDVELVAEATEQHHIEFGITDAMGNNPCSCGQWWDAAGDNPGWDQHMAEVALATLAAAGRLVPPGSHIQEEWLVALDDSDWETVENGGYAQPAGTHPDVPAPERSGEEKPTCPTCGPTTLERHPRLPVLRCANCKEHLRSDSALPVDGETT